IDPLDGTTNFVHSIPHYAISIALVARAGAQVAPEPPLEVDTALVGVVYDPNREELFTAVLGGGAWLNGPRIRTSRASNRDEALLATGFSFRAFSSAHEYMPTSHSAMQGTSGVRRLGAASSGWAWVACGRYDGYSEMALAPWAVATGTIMV